MTSITRSARMALLTVLALAALAVAAPHARAAGYDLSVTDSASDTASIVTTGSTVTVTSGAGGGTISSATVIAALNAGKDVHLDVGVGGAQPGTVLLDGGISVTATGAGTLSIDSGTVAIIDPGISTNGGFDVQIPAQLLGDVDATTQTYRSTVSVMSDTALTGSGACTFLGAVDGPAALTLATPSVITTGAAIGAVTPLASLDAVGPAYLGGDVTTTGEQTYSGAMTLETDVTIHSTSGSVTVASVDGARTLAVTAPTGTIVAQGALGAVTPVTALTLAADQINLHSAVGVVHSTGDQMYVGPVDLGNSTARAAFTSDAGVIDLQDPITLDKPVAVSGDATVQGGIIASAPADTLTKQGQGTLTLPTGQASTVTTTTVTGGTLEVDGTSTGAVTLSGGALTGTGTVGGVTTSGSDVVGPGLDGFSGARVGTLTTAALTLPGTQYDVDLGTAAADVLAASGPVNLAGASLIPTLTGSPVPGQVLTILTAPAAVTGTFTGHPEGSVFTAGGLGFTISYRGGASGTSVTLTRTRVTSSVQVSQTAASTPAGGSVTFAASVTTPGSATPSGTLTFSVDGTVVDTETLVSGQASFTTAALTAGAHAITAAYAGDTQVAGSSSAALTHSVTPPPAVPAPVLPVAPVVVLAPTFTVGGQPATVTVATLAKSGLAATVTCSERCRAQGRVYVSAKVARAIGLIPRESKRATPVLIGHVGASRTTAGRVVLTIRIPAGVRRALSIARTSFVIDYTTITDGHVSKTTTKQIRVRG